MNTLDDRRAVSTWSLHRTLGNFVAPDSAVEGGPCLSLPTHPGGVSLLELIPEIAARGYRSLQICHFHLESCDPAYLDALRNEMESNNLAFEMLLIDAGDLMAADIQPHLTWYHRWLEAAERLGAQRARICAGRSEPTPERLNTSGHYLAELAKAHPAVRIVTENWLEATPDAASVLTVLDSAGDSIGLLADLANWSAPEKYSELEGIAAKAESCHAKCHFAANGPDEVDFRRTLEIMKNAGYAGPISLIYDGPDPDEWSNLDREWEIVRDIFTG